MSDYCDNNLGPTSYASICPLAINDRNAKARP